MQHDASDGSKKAIPKADRTDAKPGAILDQTEDPNVSSASEGSTDDAWSERGESCGKSENSGKDEKSGKKSITALLVYHSSLPLAEPGAVNRSNICDTTEGISGNKSQSSLPLLPQVHAVPVVCLRHSDIPQTHRMTEIEIVSGQVAIFDAKRYPSDIGNYDDEKSFFHRVCDAIMLRGRQPVVIRGMAVGCRTSVTSGRLKMALTMEEQQVVAIILCI